jgi:glycosyltransferase involved in cell wall biosynthesis
MKDSEMDRYFGVLPNNVMIINETWSKNKLDILFNSSDIYISLHRSEGSGLTIMEAIDLEIPVICTNYSGNLDFCDENCQLVKYELVDVDCVHPSYLGVKNTKWSEPSIKDASDKLLKVYSNYVYYSEKIKITKEKLIRKYNVNSLGKTIKKFLEV